MKDVTAKEACAYRGVYQAYAWQQGYAGQIVEFRLPDENFYIDTLTTDGFDLLKFFTVVADLDDEGAIHMWRYREGGGDKFLELGCTEDSSLNYITDPDAAGFHHSSWWVEKLQN